MSLFRHYNDSSFITTNLKNKINNTSTINGLIPFIRTIFGDDGIHKIKQMLTNELNSLSNLSSPNGYLTKVRSLYIKSSSIIDILSGDSLSHII